MDKLLYWVFLRFYCEQKSCHFSTSISINLLDYLSRSIDWFSSEIEFKLQLYESCKDYKFDFYLKKMKKR